MYHLRLNKGLSYSGIVSATNRAPDVFVEDTPTADLALATGYFVLVEGNDKAPVPQTPSGSITALDTMSGARLKEYAKENGIDIKGLTRVDDIRTRVLEAEAAKNDGGDGAPNDSEPSGDDDDPANQFTDDGDGGGKNEGDGASE